MDVQIRGVVDFGTHESERIVLDVKMDSELGRYLILDTTYIKTNVVSNKVRHPYWFPNQKVKKGDVVVLYSKKGDHATKAKGHNTIYFYYWDLEISVWNDEGDCALLMHVDDWSHAKANQ